MDDKLNNATSDLNNLANCSTASGFHVPNPMDTYLKTLLATSSPFGACHCEGEPSPDVNTMIREIYAATVTETANKTDAINILQRARG